MEPKMEPREPVAEVRFTACATCGCTIGDGGLCSFDCHHDADASPDRPKKTYVYRLERVDEPAREKTT